MAAFEISTYLGYTELDFLILLKEKKKTICISTYLCTYIYIENPSKTSWNLPAQDKDSRCFLEDKKTCASIPLFNREIVLSQPLLGIICFQPNPGPVAF